MVIIVDDVDEDYLAFLAGVAVDAAKSRMPKITGAMANTLQPVFGANHFGIYFPDKKTWFLEQGTSPFTMRSLAGKTIPMWVDDPGGKQARGNPKAKTRMTEDGRQQILIFRKAAKPGARKNVRRNGKIVSVPASYPGAPGRIGSRAGNGQIAGGNVGVRWRHPGITARQFLNSAIADTCEEYGINPGPLRLVDAATYSIVTRV